MRFFLDHDVPADLALLLRSRGHGVVRLSEALPVNTPDEKVWAHACIDDRNGRTVVIRRVLSPCDACR